MNHQTFGIFFACVGYFISSLFGVTLPYTFAYYIVFIALLSSSLNGGQQAETTNEVLADKNTENSQ